MRRFALVIVLFMAAPAVAQDRSPTQRQGLVDLAYVLGQSHALRQACRGEDDQYWRTRMIRLVEVEAPDESLERRLRGAFNTGFSSARAQHPQCDAASRDAAVRAAAHGQTLASRLSQVVSAAPKSDADSPDSIAETPPPR